mgnify:FL=1
MQNSGGSQPNNSCDIGVIGLGVMGKNLALNLADHGYQVACFDLDAKRIDAIVAQDRNENGADSTRIVPVHTLEALRSSLVSPAVILLSIPAGKPVDMVCEQLIAAGIESEDVIIDTGNSLWSDSVEREQRFADKFLFFTTAVSGGEVGARFGPSLMPSGSEKAWERVGPMLRAIAAKVDPETGKPIETATPGEPVKHGEPCAAYIGPNGAGHYVKMVHNGIEYADMQLICEAYQIMRVALGMTPGEIAAVFRRWNQGPLDSYLIEISAEVLDQQDPETQQPLVDVILDKAGMKGTGLWTAVSALQTGSPAQTIAQAVFARSLSALKAERVEAAKVLAGPEVAEVSEAQREAVINQLEHALYCSKICAYAQGFQLMNAAAQEQGWTLHFAEIAKIWRAGCIIRAVFLQSISNAFDRDINLPNLLVDPFFAEQIATYQADWRATVALSAVQGVACPAMMSALSYYDSYRTAVLPANLLQGQRDFFGAHTFSRTDKPAAEKYHIEWSDPSRPLLLI